MKENPKLIELENYIPPSKPSLPKRAAHIAAAIGMRIMPIFLPTIAGIWRVSSKASDMGLSAQITIMLLALEGSLLVWMEAYPDNRIFCRDFRLPAVYALAMVIAFVALSEFICVEL